MSKTYRALLDHLTHLLTYIKQPTPIQDGALRTWCGVSIKLDRDRYERGVRDTDVVTCVRCLSNLLQDRPECLADVLVRNSVKDMTQAEDAKWAATLRECSVRISQCQSDKRRFL